MCELRLIIKTIDFLAIFQNSSKGDDVVEIEAQGHVDIVNKCFHILSRTLMDGSKSRTSSVYSAQSQRGAQLGA
jgi:hypothetical protein